MTRTERIRAALNAELDSAKSSLDADDGLREITITVKVNDAGVPRLVVLNRTSQRDLSSALRA